MTSAPVSKIPVSVICCPCNDRVHWQVGCLSEIVSAHSICGVPIEPNPPTLVLYFSTEDGESCGRGINLAMQVPHGIKHSGLGVQTMILSSSLESKSMTTGRTESPERLAEDLPKSRAVFGALVVQKFL